jgi:hypothetical protein
VIAAMQLAQKPIYTIRNGPNKQAMAWVNNMVGGDPNVHPVIMKNGGTSGFGNVVAINPTKDAAIFIGMNQVGAPCREGGCDPAALAVLPLVSVRERPAWGSQRRFSASCVV